MSFRAIRGAISVPENESEEIVSATRTLLEQIVQANNVNVDDLAGVFFTATADLDAAYPAVAARQMGWVNTPLLCAQEMCVAGSLPSCIRVMVMWNTEKMPEQIQHVYLGEARVLRPDLVTGEEPM